MEPRALEAPASYSPSIYNNYVIFVEKMRCSPRRILAFVAVDKTGAVFFEVFDVDMVFSCSGEVWHEHDV